MVNSSRTLSVENLTALGWGFRVSAARVRGPASTLHVASRADHFPGWRPHGPGW